MNQANLVSKMQAVLCSKNKIKRFVNMIEINCKPDSTRKKNSFYELQRIFYPTTTNKQNCFDE